MSNSDHPGRGWVAALGAAQQNRQLVANQLAAAVGKNRRPIDQARSIILVVPGGESSDAAVVWGHGAADRSAACGVAEALEANKSVRKEASAGDLSRKISSTGGRFGI